MNAIQAVQVIWKIPKNGDIPDFRDRVLVVRTGGLGLADIAFGLFFDAQTRAQLLDVKWWAVCELPPSEG